MEYWFYESNILETTLLKPFPKTQEQAGKITECFPIYDSHFCSFSSRQFQYSLEGGEDEGSSVSETSHSISSLSSSPQFCRNTVAAEADGTRVFSERTPCACVINHVMSCVWGPLSSRCMVHTGTFKTAETVYLVFLVSCSSEFSFQTFQWFFWLNGINFGNNQVHSPPQYIIHSNLSSRTHPRQN